MNLLPVPPPKKEGGTKGESLLFRPPPLFRGGDRGEVHGQKRAVLRRKIVPVPQQNRQTYNHSPPVPEREGGQGEGCLRKWKAAEIRSVSGPAGGRLVRRPAGRRLVRRPTGRRLIRAAAGRRLIRCPTGRRYRRAAPSCQMIQSHHVYLLFRNAGRNPVFYPTRGQTNTQEGTFLLHSHLLVTTCQAYHAMLK